jgi:phosphohistidine phosphatase
VPTRRLTLLRHAHADPAKDGGSDRDRPLSRSGEEDAALMGYRLWQRGARPSLILTSPALRARRTAQLVAETLAYPVEFLQREARLYLASAAEILATVASQDDAFRDILLCGHNPGLAELAAGLAGPAHAELPPGGIVAFEYALPSWRDIAAGTATLSWSDTPAMARG